MPIMASLRLPGLLLAAAGCCLMNLPAVTAQVIPPTTKANCTSGLHMIVARASEELPGPGLIGKVAEAVVAQIPGSDFVAVDYPAKLGDYKASQKAGVAAMSSLIDSYTTACPESKIALLGYSQGAHISGDIMCGGSEATFDEFPAISAEKAAKIAAVVLMGDPARAVSAPFNQGNATKDGVFPRKNIAGCGNSTSRMVSFCSAGDLFCDSGNDLDVHLTYVDTHGQVATQFIVDKFKAARMPALARRLVRIRGRPAPRRVSPPPPVPGAAIPPPAPPAGALPPVSPPGA